MVYRRAGTQDLATQPRFARDVVGLELVAIEYMPVYPDAHPRRHHPQARAARSETRPAAGMPVHPATAAPIALVIVACRTVSHWAIRGTLQHRGDRDQPERPATAASVHLCRFGSLARDGGDSRAPCRTPTSSTSSGHGVTPSTPSCTRWRYMALPTGDHPLRAAWHKGTVDGKRSGSRAATANSPLPTASIAQSTRSPPSMRSLIDGEGW
jgi:hypothetical protein